LAAVGRGEGKPDFRPLIQVLSRLGFLPAGRFVACPGQAAHDGQGQGGQERDPAKGDEVHRISSASRRWRTFTKRVFAVYGLEFTGCARSKTVSSAAKLAVRPQPS